jgi:dihydrolipoamide dehydrogenase
MSTNEFDIIIIGSGPGGYIAAIRAAQLGFKTACIEKDKTLGGTCLNVGCIPSKALLESSHLYSQAKKDFSKHGLMGDTTINLKKMMERKLKVVETLTTGVDFLLKKNKVVRLNGVGEFIDPGTIKVTNQDSESLVKTKYTIIATGSVPSSLPGIDIDEDLVASSTGALSYAQIPKKLIVIGGGFIGLEMGSVWSRLGSEVEVVEFLGQIVPNMDQDISAELKTLLQKQGIKFRLKTAVQSVARSGASAQVTVTSNGKSEILLADKVLVSTGRKPFTTNLGLETLGIETDSKGFIKVNPAFQTNVSNIFAIGDVIGGAMLAHKAEEEGVCCVETIAGEKPELNYSLVPGILYTHPEVASVGKTEQELKKENISYKKGKFSLKANGRAISSGETDGFIKILSHGKTDRILGAHILSNNASEMIHEFCVAMEFGATSEDIALTIHGHPTLSEAIKEAALNVHGRTLNS